MTSAPRMATMRWIPQFAFANRKTALLAVFATVSLAGCCGPLIVSHRIGHDPLAGCVAAEDSAVCPDEQRSPTPALPAMALPALPTLPPWLRCTHWKAKSRHLREDFGEFLQPGAEPPLKPPHARFHPVPTQPVFAMRAGYAVPQLVGADPHAEHLPPQPLSEQLDEIPVPIPDADAPQQPTWRELPGPQPLIPPPVPNPSTESSSDDAVPLPMNPDALRGPIGRVQFFSPEPNPLR